MALANLAAHRQNRVVIVQLNGLKPLFLMAQSSTTHIFT